MTTDAIVTACFIAAVIVAAFHGPTWAWALLVVFGVLTVAMD